MPMIAIPSNASGDNEGCILTAVSPYLQCSASVALTAKARWFLSGARCVLLLDAALNIVERWLCSLLLA